MGMLGWLLSLPGCSDEPRFVRAAGGWRYEGLALEVDAASFEPLGKHYGIDAGQAIYAATYRDSSDYFSTRRLRLTVIRQAELASFEVLDDDHARDRHRVYHEGRPFAVRHVASFALLEHGFAHDREVGYHHQTPVPRSDGRSFQAVGAHWAKDARQVWWCDIAYGDAGGGSPSRCSLLKGASPADFEVLEQRYARSGALVFHENRVVEGADAARFVAGHGFEGQADAQDARWRYQAGRRIGPAAAASAPAPAASR